MSHLVTTMFIIIFIILILMRAKLVHPNLDCLAFYIVFIIMLHIYVRTYNMIIIYTATTLANRKAALLVIE